MSDFSRYEKHYIRGKRNIRRKVKGGDKPRVELQKTFLTFHPFFPFQISRIISLPSELYHSLSLRLSLYLSDLLYVPNNAYILSIFLHSLSLISCILSPDVSFGFGLPSFASSSSTSGKPKAMFGGGSGIDGLRGIAKDQMDVGWRGIVSCRFLFVCFLISLICDEGNRTMDE